MLLSERLPVKKIFLLVFLHIVLLWGTDATEERQEERRYMGAVKVLDQLRVSNAANVGQQHDTPYDAAHKKFTIVGNTPTELTIETAGKTPLPIPWQKFADTLDELEKIGKGVFIDIGTSNKAENRTGLAKLVEGETKNTRHLTYILPILEAAGLVAIHGSSTPTKVKLV